jgi:hypothetical protein
MEMDMLDGTVIISSKLLVFDFGCKSLFGSFGLWGVDPQVFGSLVRPNCRVGVTARRRMSFGKRLDRDKVARHL